MPSFLPEKTRDGYIVRRSSLGALFLSEIYKKNRACSCCFLREFWSDSGPAVKEKVQVEEGIFETSGGICFTKQNELFVGHVAMVGFAASLLGEAITGKGILAQLNLETEISIYKAEPLLLFFILFNFLGDIGALGDRDRFVDELTELDRAVM